MGEAIEYFDALKQISKERRANNRESSAKVLTEHGVKFDSRNDGAHLIVSHNGKSVNFWPGTGKWISRHSSLVFGRGVFSLLKFLGVEPKEPTND